MRTHSTALPFFEKIDETLERKGKETYISWYDRSGKETESYTFNDIWTDAGTISHHLKHEWNLEKGDRVILCYFFGVHFFSVFLGCLRAGVTAVLVYPPGPPLTKSLVKMANVIQDCKPALILTDTAVNLVRTVDTVNPISQSRALWPTDVPFKITDTLIKKKGFMRQVEQKLLRRNVQPFDEPSLSAEDVAFLQYTSGSTGDPKGVVVTFGSLSSNVQVLEGNTLHSFSLRRGTDTSLFQNKEITCVSWLPQYHDAGLIISYVLTYCVGIHQHMVSPLSFLERPLLWIELMSRHKANISIAPDFAFRLAVRKFQEAKTARNGQEPIPYLDLSSVDFLTNTAEPVRLDTREQMIETFGPYGLKETYFQTAYGLAETVVCACAAHEYHISIPRQPSERPLVACGHRKSFHSSVNVVIVDSQTREVCRDGQTGEIWLAGPSTRNSYYGKPELTSEVYQAKITGDTTETLYLRTGDLGFFQSDYLFICGRMKDLIICNGVNYYPTDFEYAAQEASMAVRPGCIAAFSSDEVEADGQVAVVFEIRNTHVHHADEVCKILFSSLSTKIGIAPARLVAIRERTIPKTTSGKIQRRATRTKLHEGSLNIVYELSLNDSTCRDATPSTTESSVDDESQYRSTANFDSIIRSYFGESFDPELSWDELGLSSMVSVQLRNDIAESLSVTLEPGCFQSHTSPNALKGYILQIRGGAVPTDLPDLPNMTAGFISWFAMGVMQTVGIVLIFLMFALCIIPAWFAGDAAARSGTVEIFAPIEEYYFVEWIWFPVAIPTWMFSFSALVVIAKWIVVGKYQEAEIDFPSISFLKWWWTDRLVHVWEQWVGIFFKGTPFLWLFYWFMGAKVHPSVRIDKFIREFDLVELDALVWLRSTSSVQCRMFHPGNKLHFRVVKVGQDSVIGGMLCPGAIIGPHTFVGPRAVVREGSYSPEKVVLEGNPATIRRENNKANSYVMAPWWKVYILTTFWGIFSLYLGYTVNLVCQTFLNQRLGNWRYSNLIYWVFLIFMSVLLLIPVNIAMKWILLGRRRGGLFQETSWQVACEWVVDLHFHLIYKITSTPFKSFWMFWNVILRSYGLDVDGETEVGSPFSFLPSKVDLIRIRRSYISSARVELEIRRGTGRYPINIEDCNLGALSVIGPSTSMTKTVMPPTEFLSNDITGAISQRPYRYSVLERITLLFLVCLWSMMVVGSFIPAYEFAQWANRNAGSASGAISIGGALIIHTLTCFVILIFMERITFPSRKQKSPWNIPLFDVALGANITITDQTLAHVFWGTPLWNYFLRLGGASVGDRVLFIGGHAEGMLYHEYADETVVDGALIIGHNAVGDKYSLGNVFLSGIVHEGSFLLERTATKGPKFGPYRCAAPVDPNNPEINKEVVLPFPGEASGLYFETEIEC